jgi:hypothetical protein
MSAERNGVCDEASTEVQCVAGLLRRSRVRLDLGALIVVRIPDRTAVLLGFEHLLAGLPSPISQIGILVRFFLAINIIHGLAVVPVKRCAPPGAMPSCTTSIPACRSAACDYETLDSCRAPPGTCRYFKSHPSIPTRLC